MRGFATLIGASDLFIYLFLSLKISPLDHSPGPPASYISVCVSILVNGKYNIDNNNYI